jgi:hypothetical protein
MSLPGFVASLFNVTGFRTPDAYQGNSSTGSPARQSAIVPQQGPLGLEAHGFGLFYEPMSAALFGQSDKSSLGVYRTLRQVCWQIVVSFHRLR